MNINDTLYSSGQSNLAVLEESLLITGDEGKHSTTIDTYESGNKLSYVLFFYESDNEEDIRNRVNSIPDVTKKVPDMPYFEAAMQFHEAAKPRIGDSRRSEEDNYIMMIYQIVAKPMIIKILDELYPDKK